MIWRSANKLPGMYRTRHLSVMVLLLALISGLGVSAASAANAPGRLDQFSVRSVSSRPEMVSAGDSLVEVRIPAAADPARVSVRLAGGDVTGSFSAAGDSRILRADLSGLNDGPSTLTASLPGYPDQNLILVNHRRQGPLLSGVPLSPIICGTNAAGLGAPQDAECTGNTVVSWKYRTTGNSWQVLADPYATPPGNIAMTTTTNGQTVPFAVATERGTVNRGIYAFSTLVDIGPGSNPLKPSAGFNGDMLYAFGGGCNNLFVQQGGAASNPNANPNINIGDGYAYAQSSMNIFGSRCADAVSAETVSMVKERFIENWGPIDKTIGTGGSGGSMAQQMIINNYPGLLDASSLSNSFMDNAYAAGNLMDCIVVQDYVNTAAGWTDDQRHAVKGGGVLTTCDTTVAAFSGGFWAPEDCPASIAPGNVYNPGTNPFGTRCTVWDANSNLWGKLANGKARQAADNVGIQYGLDPFLAGEISAQQFLDLNANTGGLDEDGNPTTTRRAGDPDALNTAYEMGQLNEGGAGYSSTPTIDNRQNWIELRPNGHQMVHALSMRARLEASAGGPVPHVIYTSPNGPDNDTGPISVPNNGVWRTLSQWVDNIQNDASNVDPRTKALNNAPAEASDRCFDGDGNVIAIERASLNSGVCGTLYPSHPSPRVIGGAPLANDVLKCQLKPINGADYNGLLSPGQLVTLNGIFPNGVCDWSTPGIGQKVTRKTWRVWPDGVNDPTAPDTAISSSPALAGAASDVDFEFSSNMTGSSFECAIDSDTFAGCESAHRVSGLANGNHEFRVRATSPDGQTDASPATVRFRVGPAAPVTRTSSVQVANNLPRLRGRRLSVPITCRTTNMDFCRGRVTVRMRGRALGFRRNRLVQVGNRSYAVKPGRRTVVVKLNNRARRAVQRRGRINSRLTTTVRQGNGNFPTRTINRPVRRAR